MPEEVLRLSEYTPTTGVRAMTDNGRKRMKGEGPGRCLIVVVDDDDLWWTEARAQPAPGAIERRNLDLPAPGRQRRRSRRWAAPRRGRDHDAPWARGSAASSPRRCGPRLEGLARTLVLGEYLPGFNNTGR